jgi:hypothetical protein
MPEKIKVSKEELLKKLTKNLGIHVKLHDIALDGYKKQFIEACKYILNKAEKHNKYDFSSLQKLNKPQNHAKDYEEMIMMVKLHVDDTLVLTYEEFQRYILNKWDWIRSFRSSFYANYSCASLSSSPSSSSSSSSYSKEELNDYFGEEEEEE